MKHKSELSPRRLSQIYKFSQLYKTPQAYIFADEAYFTESAILVQIQPFLPCTSFVRPMH